MTIDYTIAASPIGKLLVAKSEKGLAAVRIRQSEAELTRGLHSMFPGATVARDDKGLAPLRSLILELIRGRPGGQNVTLDLAGTAFQKSVWKELRRIPSGATRSYGQIARAIGKPKASRAVAQACGANPIPVLIPCHRVISSDGGIGGYTGGLEIKRALLEAEGVSLK